MWGYNQGINPYEREMGRTRAILLLNSNNSKLGQWNRRGTLSLFLLRIGSRQSFATTDPQTSLVGTWQLVQLWMLVDILGSLCSLAAGTCSPLWAIDIGWLSGCGWAGLVSSKRLIAVCCLWLIK